MRIRTALPLIALPVLAVVALTVIGLRYERTRLRADYAAAQEDVAAKLASDLERELGELDDDARLASTLLARARDGSLALAAAEKDVLLSGFQALATVVRHYRALSVFRRDGAQINDQVHVEVRAIDPGEPAESAAAFLAWSATAAKHAFASEAPVFEGPKEGPDGRQFFVYARRASVGEAVVLVSDARYLLQPVLRSRAPYTQYVLVDPSGSIWLGCAQPETCRANTRNEWPTMPGLTKLLASFAQPHGHVWSETDIPPALGLESRPAAVAWSTAQHGGRQWILAVVASGQPIEARLRSLLGWLVATSVALAVLLSATGAFFIRHQRRAVALAERLRSAQEVAELREQTEKQLVRAEKLVTVGVLTAGLAHEIGTPLGIIRGRAELLLGKLDDPHIARDLQSMIRQIDQIGSTIRQVLDFARTSPVALKAVPVAQAVEAALGMLDWRFQQKSILVQVDIDPLAPAISADPDQLQQVLVNLLLNACDACAKDGAITIRTATNPSGGARIEIEDNGCGIAPEDLNAVFDPFFTTKKRGEGTGLGLPVAASIVRNHQGEIGLRSQPGGGSTVLITWPAARQELQTHA